MLAPSLQIRPPTASLTCIKMSMSHSTVQQQKIQLEKIATKRAYKFFRRLDRGLHARKSAVQTKKKFRVFSVPGVQDDSYIPRLHREV
jgi:hypothetical protein